MSNNKTNNNKANNKKANNNKATNNKANNKANNNKANNNKTNNNKTNNNKANNNKEIKLFTTNKDEYESLGIVRGMAITRMSAIKGFLSSISSIISDSNEKFSGVHDLIFATQNKAIEELKKDAKRKNASKVIGMQIDNSEISLGDRSGIFVVYVYGTAVK